jgi:hypothetical protein
VAQKDELLHIRGQLVVDHIVEVPYPADPDSALVHRYPAGHQVTRHSPALSRQRGFLIRNPHSQLHERRPEHLTDFSGIIACDEAGSLSKGRGVTPLSQQLSGDLSIFSGGIGSTQ